MVKHGHILIVSLENIYTQRQCIQAYDSNFRKGLQQPYINLARPQMPIFLVRCSSEKKKSPAAMKKSAFSLTLAAAH